MNNSTNLAYYGKVKIRVGRKTYSNYNTGKDRLFELFARFLCGQFPNLSELPTYIQVIEKGANSILNQPLNITKQFKRDSKGNPVTVITTAINDSNLSSTDLAKSYELVLLDGADSTQLASIDIDTSILNHQT
jgi:hypothetical protein